MNKAKAVPTQAYYRSWGIQEVYLLAAESTPGL
jgi:hypothetical protein